MNPFCPACGHRLDPTDDRGITMFFDSINNKNKYVCNRIDCMNILLDYDYWFLGIVKETQVHTCDGDCA